MEPGLQSALNNYQVWLLMWPIFPLLFIPSLIHMEVWTSKFFSRDEKLGKTSKCPKVIIYHPQNFEMSNSSFHEVLCLVYDGSFVNVIRKSRRTHYLDGDKPHQMVLPIWILRIILSTEEGSDKTSVSNPLRTVLIIMIYSCCIFWAPGGGELCAAGPPVWSETWCSRICSWF